MRGKGCIVSEPISSARITPAYAGKSLHVDDLFQRNRDHPRLCGEKIFYFSICGGGTGSPPPMRGKVWLIIIVQSITRITPAYAGKSDLLPPLPYIL